MLSQSVKVNMDANFQNQAVKTAKVQHKATKASVMADIALCCNEARTVHFKEQANDPHTAQRNLHIVNLKSPYYYLPSAAGHNKYFVPYYSWCYVIMSNCNPPSIFFCFREYKAIIIDDTVHKLLFRKTSANLPGTLNCDPHSEQHYILRGAARVKCIRESLTGATPGKHARFWNMVVVNTSSRQQYTRTLL